MLTEVKTLLLAQVITLTVAEFSAVQANVKMKESPDYEINFSKFI
jgi:hypothetical protein